MLGDGSPWASIDDAHRTIKALVSFYSGLPFPGLLSVEHPWKIEIVPSSGVKGGMLAAHYKRFVFLKSMFLS